MESEHRPLYVLTPLKQPFAPEGWMGEEFVAWTADGTGLFLDGAPLGSPGNAMLLEDF
jgi:hypothetical protein